MTELKSKMPEKDIIVVDIEAEDDSAAKKFSKTAEVQLKLTREHLRRLCCDDIRICDLITDINTLEHQIELSYQGEKQIYSANHILKVFTAIPGIILDENIWAKLKNSETSETQSGSSTSRFARYMLVLAITAGISVCVSSVYFYILR